MSAFVDAQARRERAGAIAAQVSDPVICPACQGDLDTGYECTRCGFDATPTLETRIGQALMDYDAVIRNCPANTSFLGSRACPKCGAMSDEGCRREARAAYAFIDAARKALGGGDE